MLGVGGVQAVGGSAFVGCYYIGVVLSPYIQINTIIRALAQRVLHEIIALITRQPMAERPISLADILSIRGVDGVDRAHVEQGSEMTAFCWGRKWEGLARTRCSAGSWVTETSGGGEAIGHYGLLTGSWGFHWNDMR